MTAPPKPGCPTAEHAKRCDEDAKRGARPNYGPLDEPDEPDIYDLMMGAPSPLDYEPCDVPCRDSNCPCQYKPKDGE